MSKRAIAAALLATTLSGCTIFGGPGHSKVASGDNDLSSYFDERLAAGRSYLKAGLPSRAVTAFRQASYDADSAAEAYNGMGVAYAMQGRPDVARRMFGKAVEANPYDQRFSRNLARLETRLGSEERLAAVEGAPAAETAQADAAMDAGKELPPVAGAAPERVPARAPEPFVFPRSVTSSGGLSPRTAKETHITTIDHGPATPWSGMGGNVVASKAESAPVTVARKKTRNPAVSVYKPNDTYPLRVAITTPKRAKAPAVGTPDKKAQPSGYPVRVAFGSHPAGERR